MSQAGVSSFNSSGGAVVEFLEGNSGGPVPPDGSHIIHVVGTATNGINVVGSPGTSTLTVAMQSPYSDGDFTFTTATAGATRTVTVSNTNNSNVASNATLLISTGGASAGDPKIVYNEVGAADWATGIDNSASDSYVISASASLGTSNVLSLATSGISTFQGGNVLMTKSQSGSELQLVISNLGGAAGSGTAVLLNTSTAGDSYFQVQRAGTTAWTFGLDESASDNLVFSFGAVLGTTNVLSVGAASNDVTVVNNLYAQRPIVVQTGSNTFALTDRNTWQKTTSGSAMNLTVPTNASVAFPIGTEIDVFQEGAGQVTFVAAGGVTINSAGFALKITNQFGGASLKKTASDTWALVGSLTV